MEIETRIERPVEPVIAPLADSNESKPSQRGGRRSGAGRKPNLAKRLLKGVSPEALREAMSTIDVGVVVSSLLRSKREKMRLEALTFVWDRLYGRPAQNVNVAGSMIHGHVWRPLATLTDDEVQQLDMITKKLTAPASDAPQNQIESNRAIEAEVVQSDSLSA
jgi:hypothetical protein